MNGREWLARAVNILNEDPLPKSGLGCRDGQLVIAGIHPGTDVESRTITAGPGGGAIAVEHGRVQDGLVWIAGEEHGESIASRRIRPGCRGAVGRKQRNDHVVVLVRANDCFVLRFILHPVGLNTVGPALAVGSARRGGAADRQCSV